MPEAGYVYVMHAIGTTIVKIGMSINPEMRRQQLEESTPYRLRLIYSKAVKDMFAIEQSYLRDYRILWPQVHTRGEWFEVTPAEIDEWEGIAHREIAHFNPIVAARWCETLRDTLPYEFAVLSEAWPAGCTREQILAGCYSPYASRVIDEVLLRLTSCESSLVFLLERHPEPLYSLKVSDAGQQHPCYQAVKYLQPPIAPVSYFEEYKLVYCAGRLQQPWRRWCDMRHGSFQKEHAHDF